ncbi:serine/threonine-protein kinase [Actinomadura yumaensis]|uniref:non-specific serine/threonine protein kinase n=2 Tax=Actinomadura TaxID=1988 RepID=A0ABW2CGN3_9ACTN
MAEWRVAGFTEVRRLGEGAQGRVVLARHEPSGAPVAIKYVRPGAGEAERERLRHEARMLGRADSPHVARLFRLVEAPEGVAIVMEAVDGVSLKEILEREGALGPEASLTVLKGSLLGLAAAHALGVVHRDFKPANVVVPADGRSKLVDFGIATPAGADAGGAGTPYYMAPEQWSEHVATPASDVYAATCVFVECVSGRRPYALSGRAALMNAHLTGPIPVEAVPEPLRALVASGMAKDPGERPAGAAAFVDELEQAARRAYGEDWESRGVRAVAASAAALAALFPLAAWILPGAAGAGAGGSAGSVGLAAGHAAGAGKVAAAGGVKAFVTSGGGMAAVATGTAVVVAGGAFTVTQVTGSDPGPRSTASRSSAPAATTVSAISSCRTTGPSGETVRPPAKPASVRLPPQVRLPPGAAVYHSGQDQFMIGPADAACRGSLGASGGSTDVGDARTGVVSNVFQNSLGGIGIAVCLYFPGAPEAGRDCSPSTLTRRVNVPSGVPGVRTMLGTGPPDSGARIPPSPRVAVTLATMGKDGVPSPIACAVPWDKRDLCTAALTWWFVRATRKTAIAEADLDRVAARIAAYVASARQ